MTVFIHHHGTRDEVTSLRPYLRASLTYNCIVEPSLIPEKDRHTCRWVHYGLGKGVSNPHLGVSIYGIPERMVRGLHGELIQGFPEVDRVPDCYEDGHILGFNGFVRWVYFANPKIERGILGIDWSLGGRRTAGVSTTILDVCAVAAICRTHGIPGETELALLNWRMLEEKYMRRLREELGLQTIDDWVTRGSIVFCKNSVHCPRCGQATLEAQSSFCYRCGCKPALIYKGGTSGVEI